MNMKVIFKKMIWVTIISLLLILIGNTIFYFWLSSSTAFKELEKSLALQNQFRTKSINDFAKQKIKLDYFSVNKFSWLGRKSTLWFTVTIDSHRYKVRMVKYKNQTWKVSRFDELA